LVGLSNNNNNNNNNNRICIARVCRMTSVSGITQKGRVRVNPKSVFLV